MAVPAISDRYDADELRSPARGEARPRVRLLAIARLPEGAGRTGPARQFGTSHTVPRIRVGRYNKDGPAPRGRWPIAGAAGRRRGGGRSSGRRSGRASRPGPSAGATASLPPGRALDELVPAEATTVPKAQGAEDPAVVVPLVTQHWPMLRRNLVDTAVTRGKRLVVLVGQPKALAIAARGARARRRWSKLRDRVIAPAPWRAA